MSALLTWIPGSIQVYRWLDVAATYDPDGPWPSAGRFGDGTVKTLYVAESPDGAIAEYLRRHPEFVELQESLRLRVYEIDLEVVAVCVDVRDAAGQLAAGIAEARLTSSESDESIRYAECRALASDAIASGAVGIAYPSAAAAWSTWNLVLFGDRSTSTWVSHGFRVVARPMVSGSDVRTLA